MAKWTIPVVVLDVAANPHPPATGPGWPDRKFGLIGVLSIWTSTPGPYTGSMVFTKPQYFPNQVYSIDPEYITGGPPNNPITITIPKAATDCQQNFRQNGTYNPGGGNPALFDTATVNANGVFTPGNLSLPDFTLKGTWNQSQNTITNGEIWLPYRFLWAIWGNTPGLSQTPWNQINISFGSDGANSTNATIFSFDSSLHSSGGANGLALDPNGYAILEVNLGGTGLLENQQAIALNVSCNQASGPLSVSISIDKASWTTVPLGFDQVVNQQCFYIGPTDIPAQIFYLKVQNQNTDSVTVSAAQLLY